jgi:hypothetical protein
MVRCRGRGRAKCVVGLEHGGILVGSHILNEDGIPGHEVRT